MKKSSIFLLCLISLFAFSCRTQDDEPYFKDNFNRQEFEQNLALWKDLNIQNYEFTYKIAMETVFSRAIYPLYYTIKCSVKNGKSDIEILETNKDIPVSESEIQVEEENLSCFNSMEDAFDYILKSHDFYAENKEEYKEISFEKLKYNERYFYPENFYLAYNLRKELPEGYILDSWMNPEFKIIDFKILED